jgi:hypothetical protein
MTKSGSGGFSYLPLLGIAIAFTDLVRPGGWPLLGGILAIVGAIDAVVAPRILKKGWERLDR